MRVQTFSIVAGSEACNAACPFCVSKMTYDGGVNLTEPVVRWERFRNACLFAKAMNITTVIITGKGEPSLFPNQITQYLRAMSNFDFPFIELQTNGLNLAAPSEKWDSHMSDWSAWGLTTIAISVVDVLPMVNQRIYYSHRPTTPYMDLAALIARLHSFGFSVRLAAVMIKGGIENTTALESMIDFAQKNRVEQLSIRPVTKADAPANKDVAAWIEANRIYPEQLDGIAMYLKREGKHLLTLQHGAEVYDVDGQNVCLTDCLTLPVGEDIRQVIFFPDGHLRYDWQYPGAILM